MASSHARRYSQVKLSAKEMFEISQEISREFSPIVSNTMPGGVRSTNYPLKAATEFGRKFNLKGILSRFASAAHIALSQQELNGISREINRRFSPRFASDVAESGCRIKLFMRELLAVSEEISREFAPKSTPTRGKAEIVLLPVDPQHLHAYWKIDEEESNAEMEPKQPMTIRVYPESRGHTARFEGEPCFDVAVDRSQGHQKIDLPAGVDGGRYSASIGKSLSGQEFTAYAYSNIVDIPRTGTDEYPGKRGKNVPGELTLPRKHASGLGKYIESQ